MTTYLESLKTYVGFSTDDAEALAALIPAAEPHLRRIAQHFYACITEHPEAHQVLEGPEQIERLKLTLEDWMRSGLAGPHDEEFYIRRARIGRVHVRIALPQRFMFTAVNVMRRDMHHLISEHVDGPPALARRMHDAIDRLYDIELAIMLQTYHEDSDARLRRHERLATIGQIAASIGHDLRNPLGVMQSSLYLVRKRAGEDPRTVRHLDKIGAQIDLCDDIIKNLLELARNTPPRRDPIDLEQLFQEVTETVGMPSHITPIFSVQPGLMCHADAALLRQALTNLITNAINAYEGSTGQIYLSASAQDSSILIEVADDGPGFDVETIARVFEPLVTTRPTGTGLGLALVRGVTERHGGYVEALNRPGGGAAVRLRLPSAEGEHP